MPIYADQLASVRAAKAKIETSGQRYEISNDGSGRMTERADYKALCTEEQRLIPLAEQEGTGRTGRRVLTLRAGY